MLRKLPRFTALLFTAFLFCFLLSPTALALENKSTCNRINYSNYQGISQILLQNAGSCQNNGNQNYAGCKQGVEYKTTETCPQPTQSCKQGVTAKQNTNCDNAKRVSATNGQQNSACTNVKNAQTNTPAQSTGNQNNTGNTAVGSYASEVVRLVNEERAKNNLAPLTLDKQLSAAAQVRAQEATIKFSHTRPDGSSCFSALKDQGISYRRAGENIAIGQSSPAQVVKAWMDSPGHRANILGDFTKIGVGAQQASGNYSGYSWAQFFTK